MSTVIKWIATGELKGIEDIAAALKGVLKMEQDLAQVEAARRIKELGMADIRPDWRGCDAVWDVLEHMASEGAIVLIKIDGQRQAPDDNGRYTVLVSGGPLGEDFFRLDTRNLEEGLARAIIHYSDKCWRKD